MTTTSWIRSLDRDLASAGFGATKPFRRATSDKPCHDRKTGAIDGGFGNPMRAHPVGRPGLSTQQPVDRIPMNHSWLRNSRTPSVAPTDRRNRRRNGRPIVVERRPLAKLLPYARNARTHSDAQIAAIAASIKEWGWTMPLLVDESGGLIAGHGRVMAAHLLRLTEAPVMVVIGYIFAMMWHRAARRASTSPLVSDTALRG